MHVPEIEFITPSEETATDTASARAQVDDLMQKLDTGATAPSDMNVAAGIANEITEKHLTQLRMLHRMIRLGKRARIRAVEKTKQKAKNRLKGQMQMASRKKNRGR
jgi:hypothetical protein